MGLTLIFFSELCIVALTSRGHGSHDARIMGDPRTCADPKPLSVTGSNRMAGPSNRGPCSASRPGWVHRAPYDDTGGHMLKIHGTAPHSRHTSPSSLRRGRGVLSLRARTVEKAPLPSTKVGSASGAGSTRPEGYAPWLGHAASPACPRARAQPSLALPVFLLFLCVL